MYKKCSTLCRKALTNISGPFIVNSQFIKTTSTNDCSESPSRGADEAIKIPPEPTNCCMSGCTNCVWIEYAKELTKIYRDGGVTAKEIILEKISDPSLKVFLQLELRELEKLQAKNDEES